MIAYLSGTVITSNKQGLIVDVRGVGYRVHVTQDLSLRSNPGTSCSLYIYTVVREQALDLYGFETTQEQHIFELLIAVSGIGPKVALSILNTASIDHLVHAVRNKDSSVLTKVSGIGKKNAEKIIIELENKIDDSWEGATSSTEDLEVFEALEALGYKSKSIQQALSDIDMQALATTQERIRAIIRHLAP